MSKSPGIELDVEVADRFLGFHVWWDNEKKVWKCCDPKIPNHLVVLPRYSTNSDHIYRVINELHKLGYYVKIGSIIDNGITIWKTTLLNREKSPVKTVIGQSMPHSICLAALSLIEKPKSNKSADIISFPGRE